MTRTEQIIATYLDPDATVRNDDSDLIEELYRLARLNEAYWKELGDWREVDDAAFERALHSRMGMKSDENKINDAHKRAQASRDATDAARREEGEV